jgi:hypothetical protein
LFEPADGSALVAITVPYCRPECRIATSDVIGVDPCPSFRDGVTASRL